ncbi:hypothetical protein QBC47DRAFT_364349 [Echria macrotheca]|uniref:Peptidase A1 domain-containing protein n=1 Tax=Echria macrotheca TaxID=438768 RepID=A0AAJ0B5T5_9PEZI|nr:hypothetical protein QBC47DRAFT_364349 [Echria macrotheca]
MGFRTLAAVAAIITNVVHASDTSQLPFTTDVRVSGALSTYQQGSSIFGPDGPWQAVGIMMGNASTGTIANYSGMWPTVQNYTLLLTVEAGGVYSNKNADKDGWFGASWTSREPSEVFANYSIEPVSDPVYPQNDYASSHLDSITVERAIGNEYAQIRLPIVPVQTWNYRTRSGKNYTLPVGQLGLRNLASELERTGFAGSQSFGLHIGSVALDQRGSMVLGGYDRNRIVGRVGAFNLLADMHNVFLIDVVLGVEEGIAPFNGSNVTSVYQGVPPGDAEAKYLNKYFGGTDNSILAQPDPAVPGIYLPVGTCETAASKLPVSYDDTTGYYLWDTTSPRYGHIINSSAYLGFVFSDREASNLTIKVPFKLLNLTLEAPIVQTPTQYFPCMSRNSSDGFWSLGRAFLQAAFFGANLDKNVTFLAQAPGPKMPQSVVTAIKPADITITSNPDTFADSWRSYWTASDADVYTAFSGIITDAGSTQGVSSSTLGLAISLPIVGCIAIGALGFFLWRRKKNRGSSLSSDGGGIPEMDDGGSKDGESNGIHEVGDMAACEIGSSKERYEAPAFPPAYELPADPYTPPRSRRESCANDGH